MLDVRPMVPQELRGGRHGVSRRLSNDTRYVGAVGHALLLSLLRPLVRFMVNYQFFCKKCSLNNQESFAKKQACTSTRDLDLSLTLTFR